MPPLVTVMSDPVPGLAIGSGIVITWDAAIPLMLLVLNPDGSNAALLLSISSKPICFSLLAKEKLKSKLLTPSFLVTNAVSPELPSWSRRDFSINEMLTTLDILSCTSCKLSILIILSKSRDCNVPVLLSVKNGYLNLIGSWPTCWWSSCISLSKPDLPKGRWKPTCVLPFIFGSFETKPCTL